MSRELLLKAILGQFTSTPEDELPTPYKQTNSPLLLKPKGSGEPGEVEPVPPIPEEPE
jgi:hypothetical protein